MIFLSGDRESILYIVAVSEIPLAFPIKQQLSGSMERAEGLRRGIVPLIHVQLFPASLAIHH
jgi:hypothetical protein